MPVSGQPTLARANLCAACFNWPDGVDETELAENGWLICRVMFAPPFENVPLTGQDRLATVESTPPRSDFAAGPCPRRRLAGFSTQRRFRE